MLSAAQVPAPDAGGERAGFVTLYLVKLFWPSHLAVSIRTRRIPSWQIIASRPGTGVGDETGGARARGAALAACGLAVVPGDAAAGDRTGAGWAAGAGGPLYVHPFDRDCDYRGMGSGGTCPDVGSWGKRVPVGAVAAGMACCVVDGLDLGSWRTSESSSGTRSSSTEGNYVAHNNLGVALRGEGRTDDAIAQFPAGHSDAAAYAEAQNNLAEALLAKGQADEAMPYLFEAFA